MSMLKWMFLGLAISAPLEARDYIRFTGGPSGGTFQVFAHGISTFLTDKLPDTVVSISASGGSTENLRKVNRGRAQFGVVHSGDIYLGRKGQLMGDQESYLDVLALAVLYRSSAQLVSAKRLGLSKLSDLQGKSVGIGGAGSGAAASAERFFKQVKLWEQIDRRFLGYSKASDAVKDRHLDAMWVVSGFPTSAILELAASEPVHLMGLDEWARAHKLYDTYPFYSREKIPAGTYEGQKEDVYTISDVTIWVAHRGVKEEVVFLALEEIFSEAGLSHMKNVSKSAQGMSLGSGAKGVAVPFHPGALAFWQSKGQLGKVGEK